MMIYFAQIYMLIMAFAFGARDGRSHEANRILSESTRKNWHFDGTLIYFSSCFPTILSVDYTKGITSVILHILLLIGASGLARLAVFDLGYNSSAPKFRITYIGDGTEFWEKFSIKIFGKNGAVKKAVVGIAILVIINVINYIYG